MRPTPTRIEPIFSPRLWGARSLAPLFPEKSNLKEPLGEAWLTGVDCRIASGPFAGKSLGAAWAEMPVEWRGSRIASEVSFPLLVKFIFPTEKLSLQVHPDDAYAAAYEQAAGGRGKTEMWHAVSALLGAQLLLGLKPGVNEEKFREGLASHTLEDLFEVHTVQTGDTFFVPPGTAHSIGPNLIVCEVQEYSDLTYRVYDFARVDARGKLRELHVEKALQVMNFDKRANGRVPPLLLSTEGARRSLLAACRYFATERWECSVKCEIPVDPERFELIVILEGAGSFVWADSGARYRRSECWLVPALQGHVEVLPEAATSLIRTYVPDIPALRTELHRNGISAALAQVIFD
ncbi:MAG TPA: class I mannose-6-phosphate isomerase [Candidatus Polarisedimenticolia bacterium]|nr:class I mannose-6-phosphate isomerase [Candidatus Polarisedimenticolia bacterium]